MRDLLARARDARPPRDAASGAIAPPRGTQEKRSIGARARRGRRARRRNDARVVRGRWVVDGRARKRRRARRGRGLTSTRRALARSVVIENRAASLDGDKRTLVVAIEDKQTESNLRKSPGSAVYGNGNGKVWTEMYDEPGQYVRARCGCGAETRLPIARSPYHVRYDSARLDSAKVEFLVDSSHHPNALTGAKPGDVFHVSEPRGVGFSNVLFAERSLEAAMRKNHPLVLLANGTDGLASVRSLLDWQPVMAYADAHPVTLFYLCESQESAALLSIHDEWREEGFKIIPCYGALDDQLFLMEQCFLTGAVAAGGKPTILGADPAACSVLLAGAEGDVAGSILKLLNARGIARDNILTSDFF